MSETEIQNLITVDPFADAEDPDEVSGQAGANNSKSGENKIHIRIQQRNGRKTLTTVQGINQRFNFDAILKQLKNNFACNGTIVSDALAGKVIQLQGDQRNKVYDFLLADPAAEKKKERGLGLKAAQIEKHGF